MDRWEFIENTIKHKRAYAWGRGWFSDFHEGILYIQHYSTVILVYDTEANALISWDGWSTSDRNMLNTVFSVLNAPYYARIREWRLQVYDNEGKPVPKNPNSLLDRDGWGRFTEHKFARCFEMPSWFKYQFVVVAGQNIKPFLQATYSWARRKGYRVSRPFFERTSNIFAVNMILMFRRKDGKPLTDFDKMLLDQFDRLATEYLSHQINVFEGEVYDFYTEGFVRELEELEERIKAVLEKKKPLVAEQYPLIRL